MISQYIIVGLTICSRIDFGGDWMDRGRGVVNSRLGMPADAMVFVRIC